MNWKYVKPLKSKDLIAQYEKENNFEFPASFKKMVPKINGGRPKANRFVIITGDEKVLKTFLSFNPDDKETVWTPGEWMEESFRRYLVPFAVDNFGNYVCFDQIGTVIFACHDPLCYDIVAYSFEEFLDNLY